MDSFLDASMIDLGNKSKPGLTFGPAEKGTHGE